MAGNFVGMKMESELKLDIVDCRYIAEIKGRGIADFA